MPFYPDNLGRAGRVEQLVNSAANMQTDIQDAAAQLATRTNSMQETIYKILKERGIDSLEELVEKSTSALSSAQQDAFRKLVKAARTNTGLNWESLITGLLLPPGVGSAMTPDVVASIGRFAVRTGGLDALAAFFKTAQTGTVADVAKAAETLAEAATTSEAALKAEASDSAVGATVAEEVTKASVAARRVSTCLRLLGAVGFVVTVILIVVEAVQGAQQRTKLIEAIHNCQPARLCIAYFAAEASNIIQQIELCVNYLEALAEKNDAVAQRLHKDLIHNIVVADSVIDWRKLERRLEAEDIKSSLYYGDDDLEFNTVIRLARGKEKDMREDEKEK